MATYEYKCDNDHLYVEQRSMTEPETEKFCEICEKELRRVYSAPPAIFKGKGFYSTGG